MQLSVIFEGHFDLKKISLVCDGGWIGESGENFDVEAETEVLKVPVIL